MNPQAPTAVNLPGDRQQTSPLYEDRDSRAQSLRSFVATTMENYFNHLDGQQVTDVYDMVLQEVEAPLLEIVMKNTRYNQTRAAKLLGLNRGTLRKKLKRYNLL